MNDTENNTTYYFSTDEREYTIREIDPDDGWDIGDFGLDYTITSVTKTKQVGFSIQTATSGGYSHGCVQVDDIPVGSTAYVVHVAYDTGCTFGYHGTYCVAAIVDNIDRAREIQAAIHDGSINKSTGNAYMPWDGYFEHVTGVHVDSFVVG